MGIGGSLPNQFPRPTSKQAPTLSSIVLIINSVLSLTHECIQVKFSHADCRQGNRHTHLLTKHTFYIINYYVWVEESLCFIEQTLLHDISFSFFC